MANYTIHSIEVKTTTTGKTVASVELKDEMGKVYDKKVSIWGDFPDFQSITFGQQVEGDIVVNDKGYATLYPPKVKSQPKPFSRQPGAITKAMETKHEHIQEAQHNKELGIKVSSTMRDAVLIATTIVNNSHIENTPGDMKDLILHWREWLWKQWDKEEKDYPPF
jgi:hypothetical protein